MIDSLWGTRLRSLWPTLENQASPSLRKKNLGIHNRSRQLLNQNRQHVRCHTRRIKVIPQQAEVAQGVSGRLRPRIFLSFGTTRVVGRQPYATAAFTPGEIPGTHFQGLNRPQDTWFRRGEPRKKSQVTPPGIDTGTDRLVAQCLNHCSQENKQSGLYVQ